MHGSVDTLSKDELYEAAWLRGIPTEGQYKSTLAQRIKDWIELSTMRGIPISLLIYSRAFQYASVSEVEADKIVEVAMASLPDDAVDELDLQEVRAPRFRLKCAARLKEIRSIPGHRHVSRTQARNYKEPGEAGS